MKVPAWINRTRVGAICVLICAAYALAGLYPFNFVTRNDVSWLPSGPGLALSGYALVRSAANVDLSSCPGVTLEFYLEPAEEPSREFGALMSIYDHSLPENLVVAQWRGSLLVRTAVQDSRARRRYREMSTPPALRKGVRSFLALTSGPGGLRFYADGALVRTYPKAVIAPDTLHGEIILGTGIRSATAWKGKLFGLSLFCRPQTPSQIAAHRVLWHQGRAAELATDPSVTSLYLFDEGRGRTVRDASSRGAALVIPEFYRAPAKQVLAAPWNDWNEIFSQKKDLAINIVGFVPFGFFCYFYRELSRPGRRLAAAAQSVACSCAISLAIELLQGFLPSRSSSLVDVICNTGGGFAGAFLAGCCLLWIDRQRRNGFAGTSSRPGPCE